MALSVNDGSLEFSATVNMDDFKLKLDEIEAKLKANYDKEIQRNLLREKAQIEYVQSITSSADAFAKLDDKVKIQIADLIELRTELGKIRDAQATVGEGVSTGQIDSNEGTALLAGLFVKEKQLEAAINATSTAINRQIALGKEGFDELGNSITKPVGLIDALKSKITELNQALGSAQTPEAISSLNTQLQATQEEVTRLSNIGKEGFDSLGNVIKIDVGLIGQLKEQAAQLQTALNNASTPQEIAALNKQLQDVSNQITKLKNAGIDGFDDLGNKIESLVEPSQRIAARIREITNELVGLDKGTPEFNALITEAAELTDELGDVRAQIKLLASDTSRLDAGIEAVQGLAGVFAAAQGAMALFGDENKELEKSLLKVNAAMSILQGLQQVGNLLDKNSALNVYLLKNLRQETAAATGLQAVATEGLAGAEIEATAATEGLTVAMEANPAGILLLAISALFIAYQSLSANTKDAEVEQKAMNEALAEAGKLLNDLVANFNELNRTRTQEAENALKLAQTQGKSVDDILKLQLKVVDAKKFEQGVTLATLGYDKQRLAEANSQLQSLQEQELGLLNLKAATGELTKFDQERLDKLQAQEKALRSTLDPANAANEAIKASDQEAANIRAEQTKKAHDDALKSAQAEADTRLILAKKNSKEELNARIADIRTAAKVELDNVNLTDAERELIRTKRDKDIADATRAFNILQLNNQKSLLNAQLSQIEIGSAKELELKIDLLNKSAQIEQAAEGVTAQRKAEISAKLAKDISDLTRKYAFDNQKEELDIQSANISTRLSAAKKGSEQELSLTKELIDAKASADIIGAQQQITNQKLLVAKIKEINAKARVDEKKADDEYFNNKLQEQIRDIENATTSQNIPLQAVQNDTFATFKQKYDAQKQIINNDLSAVQKQINLVGNNIIKSRGDEKVLKAQLDALELKKQQLQSDLNALDNSHTEDTLKAFAKYAAAAATAFHAIGDAVSGFNAGLADTLNTMGELANQAANVATAIASHDPAAIAAASINAISSIIKIFSSASESRKKAQAELEAYQLRTIEGEIHINEFYRERLRSQVELNKLKIEGINAESDLLKKQQTQSLADYKTIFQLIQNESKVVGEHTQGQGGFLGIGRKTVVVQDLQSLAGASYDDLEKLFVSGKLTDKAKALFEELQKLKQEGVDIDAALEENKAKAAELFTGTTSDSILDSIVQGFADGKRATADFADNFEDLMRKSILNSLKYQVLEKPLKDLYDQFASDAESGGSLDTSEIDNLKNTYNSILENANKKFEELQKVTGINFNSATSGNNSLTGAIKGMTATQADLLAGQFGGLRLTAIETLKVADSSLRTLNKIENNTAAAVQVMTDYYRSWTQLGLKVIVQ